MVNKLSETDYGYTIFLNDVRIGKHHFDHWNAFVKHKPDVKMGQKIKVCGNISEYSSAGNFGNFDAKNYYETLGIFGTIDAETIQIVDSDDDEIRQFLFESKKQMEEKKESFQRCFWEKRQNWMKVSEHSIQRRALRIFLQSAVFNLLSLDTMYTHNHR